jgi:very-short-patch-repair endonuclease
VCRQRKTSLFCKSPQRNGGCQRLERPAPSFSNRKYLLSSLQKKRNVSRQKIKYESSLKAKAAFLRNNSTATEIRLWKFLKGRQMCGFDFHRQKPIDHYIVDFFCSELNLAIEIDGISHIGREKYDSYRQNELERLGIRFLRFEDDEVFYNIGKVVSDIEAWIKANG